jgi:hypothetical protein
MKKLKNKLNKKGYRTIITTNKNKRAEIYYRKATENEVIKYLNSLITTKASSKVNENFESTIKTNTALEITETNNLINIPEPNRNKEDIFLKNTELIVHKFLNTLKEDGERYLSVSLGHYLDIEPIKDKGAIEEMRTIGTTGMGTELTTTTERARKTQERLYSLIGINYDKETYDDIFKILLDGNVKLIKNVADNVIEGIQQDIYSNLIGGQLPKNPSFFFSKNTNQLDNFLIWFPSLSYGCPFS